MHFQRCEKLTIRGYRYSTRSVYTIPMRMHQNTWPKMTTEKNLRQPGIEPGVQAWEACMLPLHYWRILLQTVGKFLVFKSLVGFGVFATGHILGQA